MAQPLLIFFKRGESSHPVFYCISGPHKRIFPTFDGLKAINPEVNVLLSSGYSLTGQATDVLRRGCRGFIQKPFNITEISKKIEEILSAPQNHSQAGIHRTALVNHIRLDSLKGSKAKRQRLNPVYCNTCRETLQPHEGRKGTEENEGQIDMKRLFLNDPLTLEENKRSTPDNKGQPAE